MPVFAPDGGAALVLARGFAVAFLLSAFGTLVFRMAVVPRAFGGMTLDAIAAVERWLLRWTRLSLLLAGLGLCAWGAVLTRYLAGPEAIGAWAGSAGEVLADTSFGHVWSLQILLLAATGAMLSRNPGVVRWRMALVLASAAVLAEVGHGHAYAMATGPSYLEISNVLHLWAAGAWLGALLPLLLVTWLALSIDNLAVGFALGTYHIALVVAAVVIGAVSVTMSLAGLELGRRLGTRAGGRGEIIGGLVLIGVGAAIAAGIL